MLKNNFMTKEQFADRYEVYYGKLGNKVTIGVKKNGGSEYLYTGLGESKKSVTDEMYFNMNVVNYDNSNK